MNEPYTLHVGDCRAVLPTLADESIDCCVTSPPYWGLRDYGYDAQIGLEPTPESFVDTLVAVFREVRRVLVPQGTLWLNLGDTYAGSWGNQGRGATAERGAQRPVNGPMAQNLTPYPDKKTRTGSWVNDHPTLKAKDLIGIPWRVAFALHADGWYLRDDIVWHKPNPMPHPIKDRTTKAHEYVFLLSKSPRYYFDQIKEPAKHAGETKRTNGNDGMCDGYDGHRLRNGFKRGVVVPEMRNARSVWTIPTRPFKGAHFATFPPALAERCVLAGCPPGGVVLDPFAGSGTVAAVCAKYGRRSVLIESNAEYAALVPNRIAEVA